MAFKCIAREKSFNFAVRIVKLSRFLQKEYKEFTLTRQVLRSGTSIGANLEEAEGAQSEKDIFAKISIAYKETRETSYWLRLLAASDYISQDAFASIYKDCEELLKIIGSAKKTLEKKINN